MPKRSRSRRPTKSRKTRQDVSDTAPPEVLPVPYVDWTQYKSTLRTLGYSAAAATTILLLMGLSPSDSSPSTVSTQKPNIPRIWAQPQTASTWTQYHTYWTYLQNVMMILSIPGRISSISDIVQYMHDQVGPDLDDTHFPPVVLPPPSSDMFNVPMVVPNGTPVLTYLSTITNNITGLPFH